MVHTESTGKYKAGDLVRLSTLGKRVFGNLDIVLIIRGPYVAHSFSYDITPFDFVAYDVYLGDNIYRDFSESYMTDIGAKGSNEQGIENDQSSDR